MLIEESNYIWLLEEFTRRDIAVRVFEDAELIEAKHGDKIQLFGMDMGMVDNAMYRDVIDDKARAKAYVSALGIPVTKGRAFPRKDFATMFDYLVEEIGLPCVLKSTNSEHGDKVFPNISSLNEFRRVYNEHFMHTDIRRLLVEKQFKANIDYRFFVSRHHEPLVIRRTVPIVVADGISTLSKLIERENQRRMYPARKSVSNRIWTEDEDGLRTIQDQGLRLDSIPPAGQQVPLRYITNPQYGGVTASCTDDVHQGYKDAAVRILGAFPGRSHMWVDFLIEDATLPPTADNYAMVELTSHACFAGFMRPTEGQSVDIVSYVVDCLFPATMKSKGSRTRPVAPSWLKGGMTRVAATVVSSPA